MVTIVDYGVGNIGSILNMIDKVGGRAKATGQLDELLAADKILLPGVGSFDNAMARLSSLGLVDVLKQRASEGATVFGICLGMQLLAESSEEGQLKGLGLIPGRVRRFSFDGENRNLRIPHMGWNRVAAAREHALCRRLDEARFYFVHSYYFDCADPADVLLRTSYGNSFASGVNRENIVGVQFHPEKSHRFGMQLLSNFLEL
ncbi:imidazole glycerol phosphate synthase subunit HisH (plasmid) [Rhizobium sp. SSM4.3]|uniref:Imidazole glycerol phosphate synthase subunit HisH n=1 Tax=Peteryoungia algae TaxID=2919917 RepID=A0ABT0CZV7_9HYPH|nr:imidazole glycerol phosphate synthase subunit HisH [Rhizobium sp. SSM4.3]